MGAVWMLDDSHTTHNRTDGFLGPHLTCAGAAVCAASVAAWTALAAPSATSPRVSSPAWCKAAGTASAACCAACTSWSRPARTTTVQGRTGSRGRATDDRNAVKSSDENAHVGNVGVHTWCCWANGSRAAPVGRVDAWMELSKEGLNRCCRDARTVRSTRTACCTSVVVRVVRVVGAVVNFPPARMLHTQDARASEACW